MRQQLKFQMKISQGLTWNPAQHAIPGTIVSRALNGNVILRQFLRRYKKIFDIKMYVYKWVKVILLFDNKKTYIKRMVTGTKEGLSIYRKYKSVR